MRRGDDPRFSVGEEHRRAVGGQDADGETWRSRDERVALGKVLARREPVDDDGRGAMNLMQRLHVARGEPRCRCHSRAVLDHRHAVVVRTLTAIEARIEVRAMRLPAG